ncbi:MAG: chromate transporter [Chthonomonadales bacterium]
MKAVYAAAATLAPVAWVFLRIGFLFFGGGFLLIPVIHRELVVHLHWLSLREFLDGVALSQLTPGPVAVVATFCGYRVAGPVGAVLATVAVLLPGFILMLLLTQSYGRVREMPPVQRVMERLVPAIVGLLAATALQIGAASFTSFLSVLIAAAALVLMLRTRVSPVWLIAGSALLGLAMHR